MTFDARACKSILPFCLLALTGCALTDTATRSDDLPVRGAAIQGVVHGGQQPVAYAHLYLLAAGTTGYGGNGIAPYYTSPANNNQSVSVFTAAETGLSDAVGAYILTTSKGNFTFPTYSCTPGTQLYLYASGGDPGGGGNSSLGLMAALGNCPAAGNLNAITYISINEITTVAAAYALAGFASDATHISSSGTALAKTGMANAFLNASNLVSLATGAALATTPAANGGNGTVPHDEIVTLADILASCINSTGTVTGPTNPSNCYTLFTNALFSGTSGTQPTDTASAIINIAHNPGANVGNLFGLATARSPYVTTAAYSQPNDWTIGLNFTGGGLSGPQGIAIDGSGGAWVTNYGGGVTRMSSTGSFLSGTSGYTGYGVNQPNGVAIDGSGNAWIGNSNGTSVTEITSAGGLASGEPATGYTGTWTQGMYSTYGVAIDASGNAWLGNGFGFNNIAELSPSGSILSGANGYKGDGISAAEGLAVDGSGKVWVADYYNGVTVLTSGGTFPAGEPSTGYTGGGVAAGPTSIAVDSSGDVWVGEGNTTRIVKLSNSGSALSPSNGYASGATSSYTQNVAIDGAGNVWVNNYFGGSVTELSNSGSLLSGANGYKGGGLSGTNPLGVAVDGSGDVWTANSSGSSVTELIGVTAPVITPICAGLPATPSANGTSNLGTRP